MKFWSFLLDFEYQILWSVCIQDGIQQVKRKFTSDSKQFSVSYIEQPSKDQTVCNDTNLVGRPCSSHEFSPQVYGRNGPHTTPVNIGGGEPGSYNIYKCWKYALLRMCRMGNDSDLAISLQILVFLQCFRIILYFHQILQKFKFQNSEFTDL